MVRETRHLWVGNLPDNISEEKILEHFKRYGRVQSVKFLAKSKEDEVNTNGLCATIAFIDIKSASKAHSGDNKVDERTLKTEYYEPSLPSTASSAIHIHERNESLTRPPVTGSTQSSHYVRSGSNSRYAHGLVDDRGYDRSTSGSHYYLDRSSDPYGRRGTSSVSYHDDDVYQSRGRPRERYGSRTASGGSSYSVTIDRNQGLYRGHGSRQHYESVQRYSSEQYIDERLGRRSQVQSLCSVSSSSPRSNGSSRGGSSSRNRHRKQRHSSPVNSASKSRSPSVGSQSPGSVSAGSRSVSRDHSRSSVGSRSHSRSRSRSRSSSSSSGHHKHFRSSSSSRSSSRSPSQSRHSRSPSVCSSGRSSKLITSPVTPGNVESRPAGSVQKDSICSTPEDCSGNLSDCGKTTLGICVKNLPVRSSDSSLKDGLYHEYKKHGKVTSVKVIGQGLDRYAVVCFKRNEDVEKSLEVSKDKLFFGCKIEVTPCEGLDVEDNEFRPLEAHLDEFHPKATRTLFIGNLEKDISTQELSSHFEPFGEIIEIDIKKQGSNSSYAFIQFSDISAVSKAIKKLDGEHIRNNRLNLGFGKSVPSNCVWLDALSESMTEKFLTRQMNRFGPVSFTVIDKQLLRALVFFESTECAQTAITELKGRHNNTKKSQTKNSFCEFEDGKIKVDFASRECQNHFYDKLKSSGQMVVGDDIWESYVRRSQEYDSRDDRYSGRDPRLPHDSHSHTGNYFRHDSQSRSNSLSGRSRVQKSRSAHAVSNRYEHDDCDRRYLSHEETVSTEAKESKDAYREDRDHVSGHKRDPLVGDDKQIHSRLKSSPRIYPNLSPSERSNVNRVIASFEKNSHYDSSEEFPNYTPMEDNQKVKGSRYRPPHEHNENSIPSYCSSPSSTKEKHRLSPDATCFNSSQSECTNVHDGNELNPPKPMKELNKHRLSMDVARLDLNSDVERIGNKKNIAKQSSDSSLASSKHRKVHSLDSQFCHRNDLSDHLERKKRLLLAVRDRTPIRTKEFGVDYVSNDLENSFSKNEICVNDRLHNRDGENFVSAKSKAKTGSSANTDLKYLQKEKVHLLHLLEQLDDGVSSSDHENNENEHESRKDKHSKFVRSKLSDIGLVVSCSHPEPSPLRKEPVLINSERSKDHVSVEPVDPRIARWKCHDRLFKSSSPNSNFPASLLRTSNIDRLKRPPLERSSVVCKSYDEEEDSGVECTKNINATDLLMKWRRKSSHSTNDTDLKHVNTISKPILHAIKSPSEPGYRLVTDLIRKKPMSLPLPSFAADWLSTLSNKQSPTTGTSDETSPKLKSSSLSSPPPHPPLLSSPEFRSAKIKPPFFLCADKKANSNPAILVSPPLKDDCDKSSMLNLMSPPKISLLSPTLIVKNKDTASVAVDSSSDSEQCSSPTNRPSFDERIRALDEKYNVWSGSTRNLPTNTTPCTTPNSDGSSFIDGLKKRNRFTFLTNSEIRKEPSDIMKTLLAKSSVFDQDSKRLEHINEKYEPKDISPEIAKPVTPKPFMRTKAAAKEFFPVANTTLNVPPKIVASSQLTLFRPNSSPSLSPPPTPKSLSVVPPPAVSLPSYLPPTPVSATEPISYSQKLSPELSKSIEIPSSQHSEPVQPASQKSVPEDSEDLKEDPNVAPPSKSAKHPNSSFEAMDSQCKSPFSHDNQSSCGAKLDVIEDRPKKETVTPNVANDPKVEISKVEGVQSIKTCKNSFSEPCKSPTEIKAERCDNECVKKEIKKEPEILDIHRRDMKPVKSIKSEVSANVNAKLDTNNKERHESMKRKLSHESYKINKHEGNCKLDVRNEPDFKRAKMSSNHNSSKDRRHSISVSKIRHEKDKKLSKSYKLSDRSKHEGKMKSSSKENMKSNSDSKSKNHCENKDKKSHESSKKKSKYRDRSNSGKVKKESNKEKDKHGKSAKSDSDKCTTINLKDFVVDDDEPIYFSMYDKVKARSSHNQTVKDQSKDMDYMRKRFNKLKQTRARREEKVRSADYDSSHQFSDELSDFSDENQDLPSAQKVKKRKFVIESSTDSDVSNRKFEKLSKNDFALSNSDSSSDSDVRRCHSSSKKKIKSKSRDFYDSDSSLDNVCSLTVETESKTTKILDKDSKHAFSTSISSRYQDSDDDDRNCIDESFFLNKSKTISLKAAGLLSSSDSDDIFVSENKPKVKPSPLESNSMGIKSSSKTKHKKSYSKSKKHASGDGSKVSHDPAEAFHIAKSSLKDKKFDVKDMKMAEPPASNSEFNEISDEEQISSKYQIPLRKVDCGSSKDSDEDVFLSMPVIEPMKVDCQTRPRAATEPSHKSIDNYKKPSHKKKKDHKPEKVLVSKSEKSSKSKKKKSHVSTKVKTEKDGDPAMPILEKASLVACSPEHSDYSCDPIDELKPKCNEEIHAKEENTNSESPSEIEKADKVVAPNAIDEQEKSVKEEIVSDLESDMWKVGSRDEPKQKSPFEKPEVDNLDEFPHIIQKTDPEDNKHEAMKSNSSHAKHRKKKSKDKKLRKEREGHRNPKSSKSTESLKPKKIAIESVHVDTSDIIPKSINDLSTETVSEKLFVEEPTVKKKEFESLKDKKTAAEPSASEEPDIYAGLDLDSIEAETPREVKFPSIDNSFSSEVKNRDLAYDVPNDNKMECDLAVTALLQQMDSEKSFTKPELQFVERENVSSNDQPMMNIMEIESESTSAVQHLTALEAEKDVPFSDSHSSDLLPQEKPTADLRQTNFLDSDNDLEKPQEPTGTNAFGSEKNWNKPCSNTDEFESETSKEDRTIGAIEDEKPEEKSESVETEKETIYDHKSPIDFMFSENSPEPNLQIDLDKQDDSPSRDPEQDLLSDKVPEIEQDELIDTHLDREEPTGEKNFSDRLDVEETAIKFDDAVYHAPENRFEPTDADEKRNSNSLKLSTEFLIFSDDSEDNSDVNKIVTSPMLRSPDPSPEIELDSSIDRDLECSPNLDPLVKPASEIEIPGDFQIDVPLVDKTIDEVNLRQEISSSPPYETPLLNEQPEVETVDSSVKLSVDALPEPESKTSKSPSDIEESEIFGTEKNVLSKTEPDLLVSENDLSVPNNDKITDTVENAASPNNNGDFASEFRENVEVENDQDDSVVDVKDGSEIRSVLELQEDADDLNQEEDYFENTNLEKVKGVNHEYNDVPSSPKQKTIETSINYNDSDNMDDDHSDEGALNIVEDPLSDSPDETPSVPRTRSRAAEPKTRRSMRTRSRKSASSTKEETTCTSPRMATRRQKPSAIEKVKRSLKVEMNDVTRRGKSNKTSPVANNEGNAETLDAAKSGIDASKKEEPKRRKGRKKKISEPGLGIGPTTPPQVAVSETKDDADIHHMKPSQKVGVYDVFEFRDSEEEEFEWEHPPHHNVVKAEAPDEHGVEVKEPVSNQLSPVASDQKSIADFKHGKISITIRLPPKDNADGTSSGAPEVVKTSDGGRPVEQSSEEISPIEKSNKVEPDSPVSPQPANMNSSPSKMNVRKSQRLLSKNTVDEVIEDVVRGNFVENAETTVEEGNLRATRSRKRSKNGKTDSLTVNLEDSGAEKSADETLLDCKSEDNFVDDCEAPQANPAVDESAVEASIKCDQAKCTPEISKNTEEQHESEDKEMKLDVTCDPPFSPDNKLVINETPTFEINEPPTFETHQDAETSAESEEGKNVEEGHDKPIVEEWSTTERAATESDNKAECKVSLRSFRISRTPCKNEEKIETSPTLDFAKNQAQTRPKEEPNGAPQALQPCGPPPVMKVELPKVAPSGSILPAKNKPSSKDLKVETDEENERSSPVVLIDPVTGYLTPVTKSAELKQDISRIASHGPPPPLKASTNSTQNFEGTNQKKISEDAAANTATSLAKSLGQSTLPVNSGPIVQSSRLMVPPPPPLLRKTPQPLPVLVKNPIVKQSIELSNDIHFGTDIRNVSKQSSIASTSIANLSISVASVSTAQNIATTPMKLLSPNLPQHLSSRTSSVVQPPLNSSSKKTAKVVDGVPLLSGKSAKQITKHDVNEPLPLKVNLSPSSLPHSIPDLHQNPQFMQNPYKELYASVSHSSNTSTLSPGGTLIRASGGSKSRPTPPNTPTTSSLLTSTPSDMHITGMQFRQPSPLVAPHLIGRHPPEMNAYVHQQMMYAAVGAGHSPYPANLHPAELRAQHEAQTRSAIGQGRMTYPNASAPYARHSLEYPSDKSDPKKSVDSEMPIKQSKRHNPGVSALEQKHLLDLQSSISPKESLKDSRSPSLTPDLAKQHKQELNLKVSNCHGAKKPVSSASFDRSNQHHMLDMRPGSQYLPPELALGSHPREARPPSHPSTEMRQKKIIVGADVRSAQYPTISRNEVSAIRSQTPAMSAENRHSQLNVETQHIIRPSQSYLSNLESSQVPPGILNSPGSSLRVAHSSNQLRQLSPHIVHDHQPRCTDSPAIANVYHQMSAQQSRFIASQQQRPVGLLTTVSSDKHLQHPPPAHQATNLHRKSIQPPSKIPKPKYVLSEMDQVRGEINQLPVVPPSSKSHQPPAVIGNAIPNLTSLPEVPPPAHAPFHIKHPVRSQPQPQTPPAASQVPPQGDSLLTLLQRYPLMWQGMLALKNDQAAVQMHFVSGNHSVGLASLPTMTDGGTPPLRIVQRMRLEQTQLEGVARRMQMEREHCMLLALPCGRDQIDVLQQSNNLHTGFISYLQQKQAAGIVNVAPPGSQQAAYVVHIFPSCEFSCEVLARIAPDLLHSVSEISHLLIIVATV